MGTVNLCFKQVAFIFELKGLWFGTKLVHNPYDSLTVPLDAPGIWDNWLNSNQLLACCAMFVLAVL